MSCKSLSDFNFVSEMAMIFGLCGTMLTNSSTNPIFFERLLVLICNAVQSLILPLPISLLTTSDEILSIET